MAIDTPHKAILTAINLTIGYDNATDYVASDIQFSLNTGELTCLIGANGRGKSTLLRTISGTLKPHNGEIAINGISLNDIQQKELARLIAFVNSDRTSAGGLTVTELVALGRQPHTGHFGRLSATDHDIVAQAMAAVGISHKADSFTSQLSDGERQKVMIARALAQETPIILLDEPTAFLDAASRVSVMKLMHDLAHEKGKAILMSTHDISEALNYADRIALFSAQRQLITRVTEEIVLSGDINMLFPSDAAIAFDALHATFRQASSHPIRALIDASDELTRIWIGNALNRNGVATDYSDYRYIIACTHTHLSITDCINDTTTEYGSRAELLDAINSYKFEI